MRNLNQEKGKQGHTTWQLCSPKYQPGFSTLSSVVLLHTNLAAIIPFMPAPLPLSFIYFIPFWFHIMQCWMKKGLFNFVDLKINHWRAAAYSNPMKKQSWLMRKPRPLPSSRDLSVSYIFVLQGVPSPVNLL